MKINIPKDTEAIILEAEKANKIEIFQKKNKKFKEITHIYSIEEILEATKNIDQEIWKTHKS
tara:strand:+ start:603 stop:788 length:186 start_codon:yes stop_codon:yes gene_type:complete